MSVYYKQNFVSPEEIFALVKEELKSYFDTGAVDDSLFPRWTDECIKKLGKASYPINQTLLCLDGYEARLPDDFYKVREAWACTEYEKDYQLPNATYTQVKQESTRIDDPDVYCKQCTNCEFPDVIQAVYKTTNTVVFQYRKQYLLTPGNIYTACPQDLYCANYNSATDESYDIRDNKFVVTFRTGTVYLQYYSTQFDCSNQLIPDEYRTQKFIELYLKQKIFEQLFNQCTDETYNQLREKSMMYKQMADEAYIMADTENKKEDVYRKQRAIRRVQDRFKRYDIR